MSPPQVWREIDLEQSAGSLQVHAGQLLGAGKRGAAGDEDIEVRYRPRGGTGELRLPAQVVIQAVGVAEWPLPEGFVLDAEQIRARVLGPAVKSLFWEITAVPEIREQIRRATKALLERRPV